MPVRAPRGAKSKFAHRFAIAVLGQMIERYQSIVSPFGPSTAASSNHQTGTGEVGSGSKERGD